MRPGAIWSPWIDFVITILQFKNLQFAGIDADGDFLFIIQVKLLPMD